MSEKTAVPEASSSAVRKTMQANRGKNTGPELRLRDLLHSAGYPGYRLHWGKAPGHPDIAYPGRRIAIFVNGCFWHRYPHCNPPIPKSNSEFWTAKFQANRERDARKTAELESRGWSVFTLWECEIRNLESIAGTPIGQALSGGPSADAR